MIFFHKNFNLEFGRNRMNNVIMCTIYDMIYITMNNNIHYFFFIGNSKTLFMGIRKIHTDME